MYFVSLQVCGNADIICQALYKFAQLVYLFDQILGDKAIAQAGLVKLKEAFAVFGQNKQEYPLVYESMSTSRRTEWEIGTANRVQADGEVLSHQHHMSPRITSMTSATPTTTTIISTTATTSWPHR